MTFSTERERQSKIHMEAQNTLDSQNDSGLFGKLGIRANTGVTIMPDFGLYNSAIVTKAAQYWQKYRHVDEWNRMEDMRLNPYTYTGVIFNKHAKNIH